MQFVLTRRGRRASGRGELDPKAASLLILGLLSISRLMSDFSRLLPRPQPCEPLSLLCASSGGSGSPAARAALRPGPPGAWDLQPQRPLEQGSGVRPVQSVASVSAASALQSSAGPGGRSRRRQVSWERSGVGQTEGSHSHRKHRANESCGTSLPQSLGYALFPSFPQATPSANSGPCPLALQAVTRQEPVTLVSLLQLREVGVQVHWVRLLSMQPEPLPLPARSRSGLLPLQSPSSSCSLTKRAFLREKPSPWPSLHVDLHLSQLLGVGLVNRLPPGLVPMCLHTWGRCPTPASGAGAQPELWSPNSSPDLESPEGVSSVGGTSFSLELRVPGLCFQPTQRVTTACSPRQLVLVAGSPPSLCSALSPFSGTPPDRKCGEPLAQGWGGADCAHSAFSPPPASLKGARL